MLRPLVLALAFAAFASQAAAQPFGNAARGSGLARSNCAACHAVGRGPDASPDPMAPRFSAVADTPGMTDRALRVWLQTSHPTMPNYILNRDDTDDIVAYILSLKGH